MTNTKKSATNVAPKTISEEETLLNVIKQMNIYEKMAAISSEMPIIAKNITVETSAGSKNYQAVSERDVLDAVKVLESKYRIASFPLDRKYESIPYEYKFKDKNGVEQISHKNMMRVTVIYRFVNIDATNEFIDTVSLGDGIDNGDKAPGKAMTYADKYALMKAYKISTGDDPDEYASPSDEDVSTYVDTNTGEVIEKPAGFNQKPASDKQLGFLNTLYNKEALDEALKDYPYTNGDPTKLFGKDCSALIDKAKNKKPVKETSGKIQGNDVISEDQIKLIENIPSKHKGLVNADWTGVFNGIARRSYPYTNGDYKKLKFADLSTYLDLVEKAAQDREAKLKANK